MMKHYFLTLILALSTLHIQAAQGRDAEKIIEINHLFLEAKKEAAAGNNIEAFFALGRAQELAKILRMKHLVDKAEEMVDKIHAGEKL